MSVKVVSRSPGGKDLGEVESEAFWTALDRALGARGLAGLRLVIRALRSGSRRSGSSRTTNEWSVVVTSQGA
ncbi:MAG: hypothetical protein JWM31_2233 [Solirubrobacterales bacterium]|nr:hypothetical protein [Solirubrobacterales bacterium]